MKHRVVVTGMGVVSPIGNDISTFWTNMKNGISGIDHISTFDAAHSPVKVAGEVKDLHPELYLGKHDAKHNAKFMQYARIAARQAFESSGLDTALIDHDRFGVFVSSSIGGIETLERAAETFDPHELSRVSPYLIPNTLVNLASGAIAIDLQAKGSNLAIVTACASGSNSIGEAYRKIQDETECIVAAGASDAAITPLSLAGFAAMRAMYTGDDPSRACIPFDGERSGTVMGEGAGIVILEELSHAQNRGATILAEIIGYGTNCDAYSITTPEQEGTTIGQAMMRAIKDAALQPSDIDYINAHGTGTVLNDATESQAIRTVFGSNSKVKVSSTKSMTGHLLGAGGAVEAIASIKALEDGFIPATIHHNVRDENCDINLVTNMGESHELDIVLSNSFGFGGHNACLIFKRWK